MQSDQAEQLEVLTTELELSEGQLLTMAGEIAETRNIRTLADLRAWQVDRLIAELENIPNAAGRTMAER